MNHAHAFGLRWASDHPMPLFAAAPADGRAADVIVERVDRLAPREDGTPVNNGMVFTDAARFTFGSATFEIDAGNRVRWVAPNTRELPHAFYSTVTAIVLAWRGLVPLHMSAVAIDGRAILIGGPSGAGKSTLSAALIAGGARLVSDDLSVLAPLDPGDAPMLWPGRPAVRLAHLKPSSDSADKRLLWPSMVDIASAVPVDTVLLLRATPIPPGPAEAAAALRRQLFRPTWMKALPRAAERIATLIRAAPRIAIHTMPPAAAVREQSPEHRADRVLALLAVPPYRRP